MDKKGRPCLCTTAIQVPQNNTQCFIFVEKKRGTTDQVDVPNTVSTQEAWELAKLHDTSYIENSSVTGEQVSKVFHMAIRKVAYLHKLNSRCHCRSKLFKWNKCKKHK